MMIDCPFAYTPAMQLILFFVSALTTLLFFYFNTRILLTVHGLQVSRARQIVAVLVMGLGLNTLYQYGFYALTGFISFPPLVYALVTVPNPITAALYYVIGVKVLGLNKYSSLRVTPYLYIYILFVKLVLRFIGFTFFAQPNPEHWNYLLDSISLLVSTLFTVFIYLVTMAVLKHTDFFIRLPDTPPHGRPSKGLLLRYFMQCCIVYTLVVALPYAFGDYPLQYLIIAAVLMLYFLLRMFSDYLEMNRVALENKGIYIDSLVKSISTFKVIKNDLYSVLNAYSGYLEEGDLSGLKSYHQEMVVGAVSAGGHFDLSARMEENPALISLLDQKIEYASRRSVALTVKLDGDVREMYIGEFDFCRVLANFLDNAIEAAELTNKRSVSFSLEQKEENSKLIVISNSTASDVDTQSLFVSGATTKPGHTGLGLAQVRNILGKYALCSLDYSYFGNVFTVYLELRR